MFEIFYNKHQLWNISSYFTSYLNILSTIIFPLNKLIYIQVRIYYLTGFIKYIICIGSSITKKKVFFLYLNLTVKIFAKTNNILMEDTWSILLFIIYLPKYL